jgi:hypothetical protein
MLPLALAGLGPGPLPGCRASLIKPELTCQCLRRLAGVDFAPGLLALALWHLQWPLRAPAQVHSGALAG